MPKNIKFRGIPIRIENEVGSIRKGKDKNGKPWEVTMSNAYGEIIGSQGVDGDPVDVFLGPYKYAKWVYVIHQTKKDGSGFDEDKCMLGFANAMEAKAAYYKNFDEPEHFFGSISTISLQDFKQALIRTKKDPAMIHASKINTAIQLYASKDSPNPFKVGDPVIVDGIRGRGVIVGIKGRRVTVQFKSQTYLSRDFVYVHPMTQNDYKSQYSSLRTS